MGSGDFWLRILGYGRYSLEGKHSMKRILPFHVLGAPGRIRTCGTRIRNPVLYPPELRGPLEKLLAHSIVVGALQACRRIRGKGCLF